MKHVNQPNNLPYSAWYLLGEIELPVVSDGEDKIQHWITNILLPLNLHRDFVDRIMKSVHEASARASQMEDGQKFQHIHLMVFGPQDRTSTSQSWGYFRIEKIEGRDHETTTPDHAIEFFLYQEGQ